MRLLIVVVVLAIFAGCACKQAAVKDCPPCPQCTETGLVQCMPEPAQEGVRCSYRYYAQLPSGEWQNVWIPTVCSPRCVDPDGVYIPGCK